MPIKYGPTGDQIQMQIAVYSVGSHIPVRNVIGEAELLPFIFLNNVQ